MSEIERGACLCVCVKGREREGGGEGDDGGSKSSKLPKTKLEGHLLWKEHMGKENTEHVFMV